MSDNLEGKPKKQIDDYSGFVNVRMPKNLVNKLDEYAKKEEANRSKIIIQAVEFITDSIECVFCGALNPNHGTICSVCGQRLISDDKLLDELDSVKDEYILKHNLPHGEENGYKHCYTLTREYNTVKQFESKRRVIRVPGNFKLEYHLETPTGVKLIPENASGTIIIPKDEIAGLLAKSVSYGSRLYNGKYILVEIGDDLDKMMKPKQTGIHTHTITINSK